MTILSDSYQWQRSNDDNWYLGVMVRGVVRNPVAVVGLSEDGCMWRWKLCRDISTTIATSFQAAIDAAEAAFEKRG